MVFRRIVCSALIALLLCSSAFWLVSDNAWAAAGDKDDPLVSKSWVDAYINSQFAPLEEKVKQLNAQLSGTSKKVVLQINNKTAYINNQAVTMDVAPQLIGNYTMLPLRFVGENFGLTVDWNGQTQVVTCTGGGKTVLLSMKTGNASLNGQTVSLPAKPVMKNDRVLVPVRFVLEAFGKQVDWESGSKKVIIK